MSSMKMAKIKIKFLNFLQGFREVQLKGQLIRDQTILGNYSKINLFIILLLSNLCGLIMTLNTQKSKF